MPRRKDHRKEYAAIGQRIRELRRSKNWSQLELAHKADLSPSYLAELERGGRNPSLETILSLAAALDVSSGYLVDGLRYEVPDGMEDVASHWTALGSEKQEVLAHLAGLLIPEKKKTPKRRKK